MTAQASAIRIFSRFGHPSNPSPAGPPPPDITRPPAAPACPREQDEINVTLENATPARYVLSSPPTLPTSLSLSTVFGGENLRERETNRWIPQDLCGRGPARGRYIGRGSPVGYSGHGLHRRRRGHSPDRGAAVESGAGGAITRVRSVMCVYVWSYPIPHLGNPIFCVIPPRPPELVPFVRGMGPIWFRLTSSITRRLLSLSPPSLSISISSWGSSSSSVSPWILVGGCADTCKELLQRLLHGMILCFLALTAGARWRIRAGAGAIASVHVLNSCSPSPPRIIRLSLRDLPTICETSLWRRRGWIAVYEQH